MANSGPPKDHKIPPAADRKAELEKILLETFDTDIGLANTRLHKAILGHLNPPQVPASYPSAQEILKKVKELLALDQELVKLGGKSIINNTAFQNTALLLAVKHGLIDVALEILKHPSVDVNARDKSDLSALQMACMLRNNVLIDALLKKGAKLDGNPSPAAIYHFQPSQQDQNNLIGIAKYKISDGRGGFEYAYRFAEAQDDKRLQISWDKPELDIYADFFIFYMQPLLRNLGWANTQQDINALDKAANNARTEDVFRNSYIEGVPIFLAQRGNIAPDNTILTRLGFQPPQPPQQKEKLKGSKQYQGEMGKPGPSTSVSALGYYSKQKDPNSKYYTPDTTPEDEAPKLKFKGPGSKSNNDF